MKERKISEENIENKESKGEKRWGVTEFIGVGVTGLIVLATFVIAIIHVCRGQENSTLLQTLLPLWGTWVGTVLAFYFGKNNLDTATKSYNAVIEKLTPNEKMSSLLAKDIMISVENIVFLEYEKERNKKINDILTYDRFRPYNRFAVFESYESGYKVKCIIHRSSFHEFISQKVNENMEIEKINKLTLDNILADPSFAQRLMNGGFAVVSICDTLLKARDAMTKEGCVDVFITENGRREECVRGLVTNNMILRELNI